MAKISLIIFLGICAVLVCGCLDTAAEQKSVMIDGYTFTASLNDKWVNSSGDVSKYKPADLEDQFGIPDGAYDWTGFADYSAFDYRSGEPSGSITKAGWAHIFVLKPDEDLADNSSIDILKHAAYMIINPKDHRNAVIGGDLTEKEIEYNGRQAYYIEVEGELITPENYHTFINDNSLGAIAFFLDDDTVALIDVETTNDFGMSAWDVINSITVN
ncbi:MAG: hypothetical protein KBB04_05260 [Methanothrix sp.]|jgi:hypothetical protein|uniref:hypothetical protein n=1 Tax=Methanothrix sp. TaxID=90426 RepID=UPI001B57567F|nr:hypothetical protein [Methanothrix sp.]MBP7067670.1 hypothetical protein [Methanothrix sp.]